VQSAASIFSVSNTWLKLDLTRRAAKRTTELQEKCSVRLLEKGKKRRKVIKRHCLAISFSSSAALERSGSDSDCFTCFS
jgi:hypothetical protein